MGFILGNNFDIWRTCREQLFAYLLRVVYKCSCYNQSTHVVFLFVCFFFNPSPCAHNAGYSYLFVISFCFSITDLEAKLKALLWFIYLFFCVCSLFFSALDSVPTWMTTTRTSWKGRTFWWLIMMLTMRKTLKAPTIGGTGRCLGGEAHLRFVVFFCFWSCRFPADFKSALCRDGWFSDRSWI